MAVGVKWTPLLAIGHPLVDEQHKELMQRINLLLEAMMQGQGRDKIAETIVFLGDYVNLHFSAEEALMREKEYPQLEAHQGLHRGFIEDFQALRALLERDGPSSALLFELQKRVVDWIIQHIGGADKMFGAYLKKRP